MKASFLKYKIMYNANLMNSINLASLNRELQEFCENAVKYYDCGYPYGPFIPYAMPGYASAAVKIFYIGRDTYGWVDKSALTEAFDNGIMSDYLAANSCIVTPEKLTGNTSWTSNPTSFWGFVTRLHLLISTGKYRERTDMLDDAGKTALSQIGYGNLNSIELPETLGDAWNTISPVSSYWSIRKEARRFEKIKLILDTFAPDCIFILSWTDRDDIFDGLNVNWHQEWYKDDLLALYTVEGYDTKIIWTAHPRRFAYLGLKAMDAAKELACLFDKTRKM